MATHGNGHSASILEALCGRIEAAQNTWSIANADPAIQEYVSEAKTALLRALNIAYSAEPRDR